MDEWILICLAVYIAARREALRALTHRIFKGPLPISILGTHADELAGEKSDNAYRQTDRERED